MSLDWRSAFRTDAAFFPTKDCFQTMGVYAILSHVTLALIIIFLLGIGNFAMHRAVLESGHPLLGHMPAFLKLLGGRLSLLAEFMVLIFALLLAANGWASFAWAYFGYSVLNGITAWFIVSGRL